MRKPDVVFACGKCGHLLFIDKKEPKKIYSLSQRDCPNCGEEGEENWIFVREGDYQKEYGTINDSISEE